ncbi:MAG: DNA-binding response regulator [Thermoleophilia bacterium]|nr:DNA-binding response regulator [Thermoleophilia bacterium]
MPKTQVAPVEWYTVGQAADFLGIAQSSFRKWVDAGLLESFTTPGGHRRVTRAALDRFVQGNVGSGAPASSPTVLVIDDDPAVRATIRASLEAGNFSVTEAGSAAEGVTRINERIPDLLMIDICMPGTDGWQLLQKLRERLDVTELPVLVFSGSDSLDATDARGAQAYARKPFDPTRLVAQARLLCDHCREATT